MNCPKCGAQNPDNVKFCRACGNPMAAEQPGYFGETLYAGDQPLQQEPVQPDYSQQYQQPQYAQPDYSQPQYAPPAQTKSKLPLIIIIAVLVIGIIIGIIVLATKDKDDDDDKSSKKNSSSSYVVDIGGGDDDDSDDIDIDDSDDIDDPFPGGSSSQFVGKWQSVLWIYDGNSYSADDPTYGDTVKSMMNLDLKSDGTGTATVSGTSVSSLKWKSFDGGIIIDDGVDEIQFSYSGGQLVATIEESIVYLSKIG